MPFRRYKYKADVFSLLHGIIYLLLYFVHIFLKREGGLNVSMNMTGNNRKRKKNQ